MKVMYDIQNLDDTDLYIVMGTALAVGPVNQIPFITGSKTPKVLINMTDTAEHGFPFDDKKKYPERLFYQGKCDEIIQEIVNAAGWKEEFKDRIAKTPAEVKETVDVKNDEAPISA